MFVDKKRPAQHSLFSVKKMKHEAAHNSGAKCVICPPKGVMVAQALGTSNHNCIVQTNVASDLIVQLGDFSFHLHKLPMVSRSGYLNRAIFEKRNKGPNSDKKILHIKIDDFPGGFETFEMVVKFCYGWKVELTASNVAPLYCAAHFLEMSDELEQGNLIPKTEAFLSFLLFSSWKDTFRILRSCEPITPWAKQLHVLKRCSEAIAWKASTSHEAISLGHDDAQCLSVLLGNANSELGGDKLDNWWFEDVSYLRIDHFILVIESIKKKGSLKPEIVGSCIARWTAQWMSRINFGLENLTPKHLTFKLHRVTTECIIKLLPEEKNSVSCNFLLHLLKAGLVMKIDTRLLHTLERRAASVLERCSVLDILVKNHGGGDDDTTYDVNVVIRAVRSYASSAVSSSTPGLLAVGKLVDGYLALVAGDEKLTLKNFKSLVEALPKHSRQLHDNLYRAIDMYFKAHPGLTEEERQGICKAIENHKLSKEAREHAMHNDRLPMNITTRIILLEQVDMARSSGSGFQRTRARTVIRSVARGLGGWLSPHNEINTMKREVETMKVQLNELKMCKSMLQRQARSFVR